MDKEFLKEIDSISDLFCPEKLDDEVLICECFCVNVRDIREMCHKEVDLDLLRDQFSLGLGCQSCLRNADNWLNKIF